VREPFIARFPGRIPKNSVCKGVAGTVDIVPTVLKLTGAPGPKLPVDGIDIWPLMSGAKASLEREALLYFDGWNLQCARWKQWKLHVARYNTFAYSPAPAAGRVNLPLTSPELYDVERDPTEAYDVAAENPTIVVEILARMERLIPGFPAEVRNAWAQTRDRQTAARPAGALPAPAPPK
jgi:arylsulfatase